ncbi:MAG: hypothetical protein IT424_14240 [Pirellulales bacterium]|nr:hypothetical protein [Pirellulales bacterium]
MFKPSVIACAENLFVGGAIGLFLGVGILVGNPLLFAASDRYEPVAMARAARCGCVRSGADRRGL